MRRPKSNAAPEPGLAPSSPVATPRIAGSLTTVALPIGDLCPYARNARPHSDRQIDLIARSIRSFGFVNPILVDRDRSIVAGHGRYEAARRLGMATVPVVFLDHLTPAEVRAYRIADNRIAELSDWDADILRLEIGDLVQMELAGDLDFEVNLTGFSTPEIDIILDSVPAAPKASTTETVELPAEDAVPVSQSGDLWHLGEHRLLCGNALDPEALPTLLGEDQVRQMFTDPPYNVPIRGHVSGTGRHREFAMGVGEMSVQGFRDFLAQFLSASRPYLIPGATVMVCMDWRHVEDLIAAGRAKGLALINLCVWNKTDGGMGSLYRSKHELIAVFKAGDAPHVNTVELGRHGRYRTNVWDYAGVNTFRRGRAADLADHPTVKPTALVADAIRDVTHRGDIVLDPFAGSGTTALAAEKAGRRARLVEIDPLYVDVAIRRWQTMTGQAAIHAQTGETFAQRAAEHAADTERPPKIGGLRHGQA